MTTTLFGNGALADAIKVIKVGPNPWWLLSRQEEEHLDAEREGESLCDTEAESRVLWLQAKECQGLSNTRSWEEAKDILPYRECQHFDFRLIDSRTEILWL